VEAYKGAELIKGEQLRTAYNSAKTVLIPAVNGYTAYLGGTAIMPQMRYNLSYSNGTWSVDNRLPQQTPHTLSSALHIMPQQMKQ
jgi:alpha-N-acetylglucosamine transferase